MVHTFLDYIMENDAIYTHLGGSYLAEEQLTKFGINNINGMSDAGFWRDTSLNVAYEHTAFTKPGSYISRELYVFLYIRQLVFRIFAENVQFHNISTPK